MRLLMFVLLLLALPAHAACPPDGYDPASLQALKARQFATPDAATRHVLAQGLVDCLGDPDPAIRDGIAYEALAHWMRAAELDAASLRSLRDRLYVLIEQPNADGFRRPFAALVLSEVARTDRIAPWMTSQERAMMVERAAGFVEGVSDYRGYDDREGWRHGVAHGADWLMQLSLNPALPPAQLDRILLAVATQVVPAASHAYVFGEPARLARPVQFIAARGLHSDAQWQAWFSTLAPRLGDPALAYVDSGWLARHHDLQAFLDALYLAADRSGNAQVGRLKPIVAAALDALP
ncbi:MAG: DUF2785 domain-containing protein [Luteimonas sp.]